MTETPNPKSSNFIRDQFVLTIILVIALLCRFSLTSSSNDSSNSPAPADSIASDTATPEAIVSTK